MERPRISSRDSYYFFFRVIRSSNSLPSRDKLSRRRNKNYLYFRETSRGGLGVRLPFFQGKVEQGTWYTTFLSGTPLSTKKGLKILPFPGIIWAGDIEKGLHHSLAGTSRTGDVMKTISFLGTHLRGVTGPPTPFPPVPFSPERLASGRWSTTRYKNKKKE